MLFYFWYLLIVFRRVSNLSSKVMLVNLIQYRGTLGVFNSSNLFSDKLLPKLTFQSLLGLLLNKSIFLSLLFFCLTEKNVKKIQILSSRAVHNVAVILLVHHIRYYGYYTDQNQWDIELNPTPKQKQDQSLLICHWNRNSIPSCTQLPKIRTFRRLYFKQ